MACGFCSSTNVSPCPVCEVRPATQTIRRVAAQAPVRAVVAPKVATPAVTPPPAVATRQAPAQAAQRPTRPSGPRYVGLSGIAAQAAKVRTWWAEGMVGSAALGLLRIHPDLDPNDRSAREIESIICLIDTNASVRGFISERDAKLRASIVESLAANWVRTHGFDPRFEAPPSLRPSKCVDCGAPVKSYPTDGPNAKRVCESCLAATPDAPDTVRDMSAVSLPPMTVGDWRELNRRVNAGELSHAQGMAIKADWDARGRQADDVLGELLARVGPGSAQA